MSKLQAQGAVSLALDDLSENPLIAFLRSWSNGRIPRACFSWATASKSSASASTTGSQDGDRRIISQTHEVSQPQGRGTWPRPQGANLTVGRGEVPLPTHSAEVRLDLLHPGADREVHLHQGTLGPYTPMSPSLRPLCPFESFRAT